MVFKLKKKLKKKIEKLMKPISTKDNLIDQFLLKTKKIDVPQKRVRLIPRQAFFIVKSKQLRIELNRIRKELSSGRLDFFQSIPFEERGVVIKSILQRRGVSTGKSIAFR